MNNEEKILAILEQMQTDVAELKADVSELKADVSGLKESMENVQEDLAEVKQRVIIIENEHGKDIKALYDGYSMNYDISQDIRDEVKKISHRNELRDMKIMNLELRYENERLRNSQRRRNV